jgi:hypothetical protein
MELPLIIGFVLIGLALCYLLQPIVKRLFK